MTARRTGSVIGGAFGLVFVLINAGGLPRGVAIACRVAAVVAFVLVVVATRRRHPADADDPGTARFGRGYLAVVALEVVAVAAGVLLLKGPLHTPRGAVCWVAAVVGVHFFGLAAVWKRPALSALGAALAVLGVLGLVLAAHGSSTATVDTVGGVLPGAVLLAGALWSSWQPRSEAAAPLTG